MKIEIKIIIAVCFIYGKLIINNVNDDMYVLLNVYIQKYGICLWQMS